MRTVTKALKMTLWIVCAVSGLGTHPSHAVDDAYGSMNLDLYCSSHYGYSYRAVNLRNDAYGWTCSNRFSSYDIEMEEVCMEQYGNTNAQLRNINDPNSWYCAANSGGGDLGLDFDRYCQENIGYSAYSTSVSSDAYSWRCMFNGRAYPVDVDRACQQQIPGTSRGVASNVRDANSWYCQ